MKNFLTLFISLIIISQNLFADTCTVCVYVKQTIGMQLCNSPMSGAFVSLIISGTSDTIKKGNTNSNGEICFNGVRDDGTYDFQAWIAATCQGGSITNYSFTCPQSTIPVICVGIPACDKKELKFGQNLLFQNYPNPFNPITKISYTIFNSNNVKIVVYDLLGKEVTILVNEYKDVGSYSVDFDASNLSSGIYIYKMEVGNFSDIKRMLVIK